MYALKGLINVHGISVTIACNRQAFLNEYFVSGSSFLRLLVSESIPPAYPGLSGAKVF